MNTFKPYRFNNVYFFKTIRFLQLSLQPDRKII